MSTAHEPTPAARSRHHTRARAPRGPKSPLAQGALLALAAAIAFGLTTPLVQRFGRGVGPVPTATLLYAGACVATVARRDGARLSRAHLARLVLVAMVGAILAPVCLAWGLQRTPAAGASLLLNFEAVFTVLLGAWVHREPLGARVLAAVSAMLVGGALLVVSPGHGAIALGSGALAVLAATFAWAVDNTLTRPLADLEPADVVRTKSLLGALCGVALARISGQAFPNVPRALALAACGATGYGLSLRLYLLAQRRLGAARTGSLFAVAPFIGAAAAWAMGEPSLGPATLAAAAFFALGVYLHVTEHHEHEHTHDPVEHEHPHRHDDGHHVHTHDPPVAGEHTHPHHHEGVTHAHPHGPDLHHRHGHD